MRLLITGATGRVGSRLVPRLLDRGDAVRILVRRDEQTEPFRKQGGEAVVGDLLRPDTLTEAVAGVDSVIHLAAFFRGATEAEAHATNHVGTLELARTARQAGASRFIFISTTLIYGPGRGRPTREQDAPQPASGRSYPVSKLAAEQALAQFYRDREAELCILRLAFVYGEGDPHLSEAINLTRTWHPEKRIHLVHHADVAQAIILNLDKPGSGGQIYNIADDAPMPISVIRQLNGINEPKDKTTVEVDDPWEGIVDTTKIKDELGFRPIYPSIHTADEMKAL